MKKIITIIILIIIGITNLNYKTYHQNAFDLLMEINENNANANNNTAVILSNFFILKFI